MHPHLVLVIKRAAEVSQIPFIVTEGLRTRARQAALFAEGKSQTTNSRHLTGHAVDLAVLDGPGKVTWEWAKYVQLSAIVKDMALTCDVPIVWGGDWKSLRDGPHYELDRKVYP